MEFRIVYEMLRSIQDDTLNLIEIWNRQNEQQVVLQTDERPVYTDWNHWDCRRHAVKLVLRRQDGSFILKNNALQTDPPVLRRQVWTSLDQGMQRIRYNLFEEHMVTNILRGTAFAEFRMVAYPCLWLTVARKNAEYDPESMELLQSLMNSQPPLWDEDQSQEPLDQTPFTTDPDLLNNDSVFQSVF